MHSQHDPIPPLKLWRRGPTAPLAFAFLAAVFALIGLGSEIELSELSHPAQALKTLSEKVYELAELLLLHLPSGAAVHNGWLQVAALLVVASAGSGVYYLISRPWTFLRRKKWALFRQPYVVVCGIGRIGEQIVLRYLSGKVDKSEQGTRVIALEKDENHPAIKSLRSKGAVVIVGDASDREVLSESGALKAQRVFAVTGSDLANIQIAALLSHSFHSADKVKSSKKAARSIKQPVCHVHITDPVQIETLRQISKPKEGHQQEEISRFNIHRMGARHLLDHLLRQHRPVGEQVAHYFLIGFGLMGQEVALELAMQAHFANHKRARLTILDPNIDGKADAFLDRYPAFSPGMGKLDLSTTQHEADSWEEKVMRESPTGDSGTPPDPGVDYVCNAEFLLLPTLLNGRKFHQILESRLNRNGIIPSFVVCLEDEQTNLTAALDLRAAMESFAVSEVMVWLTQPSLLTTLLHSSDGHSISIIPFGNAQDVCHRQNVVDPNLLNIAKEMHSEYVTSILEKKPDWVRRPNVQPWENLREDFRFSNIQRAHHIDVKLGALGMKRAPKTTAPADRIVKEFTPAEREILAEMEHNRWLAERLMGGWRYGIRNDETKHHNDIIPYACLPEEIKEYDRNTGDEIIKFLGKVGDVVVR